MIRTAALAAACLTLAACATPASPPDPWGYAPPIASIPDPDGAAVQARTWRGIVTDDDLDRLNLRLEAWSMALDQARRLGGEGDFASLGALTDPRAALDGPTPPPGDYACRTVKMGQQGGAATLGYAVYGWFVCRIDQTDQGLRLVKLTGSQRPSGLLFPEDAQGMVFLGSMAVADEPRAHSYGLTPDRDFAGRFERIGDQRWRLVVPFPDNESILDLIEFRPLP